jgi:aminotransferase
MSRVLTRSATLAPREQVAAMAKRGIDVISLAGGTSEFDLAGDVKEAVIEALRTGPLGPTDSRGTEALRNALSRDFHKETGVELDPEGMVVTVGAKEATMATFMALLDSGDEVLLPDPAWIGYEPWILRAGASVVKFPMGKATAFRPDWNALRELRTARSRLLILTNPHNPTGTLLTEDEMQTLSEIVDGSDVLIVADESNCRVVFEGREYFSPLQIPALAERIILIRSYSKSFAMGGWRLGFVWSRSPHADAILAAHEHAVSCVPAVAQIAALAVLNSAEMDGVVERMMAAYEMRRRLLVGALNAIPGVSCHLPEGAYNSFPDFSKICESSDEMARRLLEKGVLAVPGSAFGSLGEGHLRMSFTPPEERLGEAVARIEQTCAALAGG